MTFEGPSPSSSEKKMSAEELGVLEKEFDTQLSKILSGQSDIVARVREFFSYPKAVEKKQLALSSAYGPQPFSGNMENVVGQETLEGLIRDSAGTEKQKEYLAIRTEIEKLREQYRYNANI